MTGASQGAAVLTHYKRHIVRCCVNSRHSYCRLAVELGDLAVGRGGHVAPVLAGSLYFIYCILIVGHLNTSGIYAGAWFGLNVCVSIQFNIFISDCHTDVHIKIKKYK